ncbi:MAG: hypothetical protein J0H50_11055 [Xanthomonadales bacterium]|nr:hypothetical protein [Xanthomonadales bacterium]
MDVIAKAKTQLKSLQRQIADLQSRQDRLSQFIATFEELRALPEEADDLVTPAARMNELAMSRPPRTAKAMIVDAVQQILADGRPRHSRELLAILEEQRIAIGGKNKLLALSAILSKDESFRASRKVGWSLSTSETARPEPAATGSGLFIHSGEPPDPTP